MFETITIRQLFATNAQKAIISNPDTLREITAAVDRKYSTLDQKNDAFYNAVAAIAVMHADALMEALGLQ